MVKLMPAVVLLILVFASGTSLCAPPEELSPGGWAVQSADSYASHPPSDDVVLAFVRNVTGGNDQLWCVSPRFVNLRGSATLSLVVSTEGVRNCGIQIIDKKGSGYEVYDVDSGFATAQDLNGTGVSELIADTDLTANEGANHCQAQWPVIYAWTGNGYTDVSKKYKGYYEQKLSSLKKQIADLEAAKQYAQAALANEQPAAQPTVRFSVKAAQVGAYGVMVPQQTVSVQAQPTATPTPRPDFGQLDCLKAETAKIERFLGISRDAGMNEAIQWANSDDPLTRTFAAEVFSDIGTAAAIHYLQTLSNDSNRTVAGYAKHLLPSVGQSTVHTVDRADPNELQSK